MLLILARRQKRGKYSDLLFFLVSYFSIYLIGFSRGRKYYESQGTVSKISSSIGRIRGVLKATQPIEGALNPVDAQTIENGTVEDILITECGNIFRDLSAWRVSILSYQVGISFIL